MNMKSCIILLILALLVGCTPRQPSVPLTPNADPGPSAVPSSPTTPTASAGPAVIRHADIKGIWLSQFDLTDVYLENGRQRPEEDFTIRMAKILDNVRDLGFNTVFLQIRPNADSMYPSRYYPMSAYVVGVLGGEAAYDPVAVTVGLAHARQLSIHAWINPMRGMSEEELLQVGTQYPLRQWYDDPQLRGRYLVLFDGRWYLNPAYPEVRAQIQDGAAEALALYDFDGLHMDDYFYPTAQEAFDRDAYQAYQAQGGTESLADFRRDALNQLVAGLRSLTGASREGRLFGISPAGNVDTVVNSHFADVSRWCSQPGYVDYICPQVYWGLEHGSFDFVKVCQTWQDMIQSDSVFLLVGMTFGKAFTREDPWAGSGRQEWVNHRDVLARSLKTTADLTGCQGISVFCYQYFYDPVTGYPIPETAEEVANFLPVLQEISWRSTP